MTRHDFGLSEVLSALQNDESGDLVRRLVSVLYQVLIVDVQPLVIPSLIDVVSETQEAVNGLT